MATLTLSKIPDRLPREVAAIAEAAKCKQIEIEKLENAQRQLQEQRDARIRRKQQIDETVAVLRERFPEAFSSPPVPLAVGIYGVLREATSAEISAKRLRYALSWWTKQQGYLEGLAASEPRRNVDGSIAGPADPDHVLQARQALKERALQRRKQMLASGQ